MKSSAKEHLNDLSKRYPALMCCAAEVEAAAQQMIACYQNGGKLLVCGNGGSASDSLHIVGELMKGFVLPRKLDENMQKRLQSKMAGYLRSDRKPAGSTAGYQPCQRSRPDDGLCE